MESLSLWVIVYDVTHQECVRQIPPQGGLQADMKATSEREGHTVYILPTGGHDGRSRNAGGGDLHLPPPKPLSATLPHPLRPSPTTAWLSLDPFSALPPDKDP